MDDFTSQRSWPARSSAPGEPTWEVALLYPAQGAWQEEDYLSLETNRLVELVDGRLEVLPMPTILHQLIVGFLYQVLQAYSEATSQGLVLFAPLPVRLCSGRYREPDIVYLCPERAKRSDRYPQGADLVMEVLSESEEDRERDLRVKRDEYAAAGIAEYWIVDPQMQQITVLALEGGCYQVHGTFQRGMTATSKSLAGFEVAVEQVFAQAKRG